MMRYMLFKEQVNALEQAEDDNPEEMSANTAIELWTFHGLWIWEVETPQGVLRYIS